MKDKPNKIEPTVEFKSVTDYRTDVAFDCIGGLAYEFDHKFNILVSRLYVVLCNESNDLVIGILNDDQNLYTVNGTRISINDEEGTIHAEELYQLNYYTSENNLGEIHSKRILRSEIRKCEQYLREIKKEQSLITRNINKKVLV